MLKNKLFKGLTEHDILTWEEEKVRYQRRMGQKVTDLQFLRHLLMVASRPVISAKDGVASGFLTGQGPIYEKADVPLDKYGTRPYPKEASHEYVQTRKQGRKARPSES